MSLNGSLIPSPALLGGRVYGLCLFFMTGAPEGSTESVFGGKLIIEPATPGLQHNGLSMSMI